MGKIPGHCKPSFQTFHPISTALCGICCNPKRRHAAKMELCLWTICSYTFVILWQLWEQMESAAKKGSKRGKKQTESSQRRASRHSFRNTFCRFSLVVSIICSSAATCTAAESRTACSYNQSSTAPTCKQDRESRIKNTEVGSSHGRIETIMAQTCAPCTAGTPERSPKMFGIQCRYTEGNWIR